MFLCVLCAFFAIFAVNGFGFSEKIKTDFNFSIHNF
jgi:hypothetical protein